jgi:hypothetical protein
LRRGFLNSFYSGALPVTDGRPEQDTIAPRRAATARRPTDFHRLR